MHSNDQCDGHPLVLGSDWQRVDLLGLRHFCACPTMHLNMFVLKITKTYFLHVLDTLAQLQLKVVDIFYSYSYKC